MRKLGTCVSSISMDLLGLLCSSQAVPVFDYGMSVELKLALAVPPGNSKSDQSLEDV